MELCFIDVRRPERAGREGRVRESDISPRVRLRVRGEEGDIRFQRLQVASRDQPWETENYAQTLVL